MGNHFSFCGLIRTNVKGVNGDAKRVSIGQFEGSESRGVGGDQMLDLQKNKYLNTRKVREDRKTYEGIDGTNLNISLGTFDGNEFSGSELSAHCKFSLAHK